MRTLGSISRSEYSRIYSQEGEVWNVDSGENVVRCVVVFLEVGVSCWELEMFQLDFPPKLQVLILQQLSFLLRLLFLCLFMYLLLLLNLLSSCFSRLFLVISSATSPATSSATSPATSPATAPATFSSTCYFFCTASHSAFSSTPYSVIF